MHTTFCQCTTIKDEMKIKKCLGNYQHLCVPFLLLSFEVWLKNLNSNVGHSYALPPRGEYYNILHLYS